MAAITLELTYPGSAKVSLRSKDFSNQDKATFRRANLTALKNYFGGVQNGDFPTLANTLPSALVPTTTIQGPRTLARIHVAPARNPRKALGVAAPRNVIGTPCQSRIRDEKAKIKSGVERALKWLDQSQTLVFPNDRLDIFIAEENTYSLGYLWQDPNNNTIGAAILLGGTAGSWSGDATTKTVAQECYEHYKPAVTINALERRIMATLVHEMGHIYHQMHDLERYMLLARVSELADKEDPTTDAKWGDFFGATKDKLVAFRKATRDFGRGVSFYAQNSGLNEFVAEVFCALVMGSPMGSDNGNKAAEFLGVNLNQADILTAYRACGGPVPEVEATHVRKA